MIHLNIVIGLPLKKIIFLNVPGEYILDLVIILCLMCGRVYNLGQLSKRLQLILYKFIDSCSFVNMLMIELIINKIFCMVLFRTIFCLYMKN